jgi:hypothetical protein
MLGQTGGDETHAARLTLTWGILWSLDTGTTVEMLLDLVALLQFELNLRRLVTAEGELKNGK